jgi:hypothetical protein
MNAATMYSRRCGHTRFSSHTQTCTTRLPGVVNARPSPERCPRRFGRCTAVYRNAASSRLPIHRESVGRLDRRALGARSGTDPTWPNGDRHVGCDIASARADTTPTMALAVGARFARTGRRTGRLGGPQVRGSRPRAPSAQAPRQPPRPGTRYRDIAGRECRRVRLGRRARRQLRHLRAVSRRWSPAASDDGWSRGPRARLVAGWSAHSLRAFGGWTSNDCRRPALGGPERRLLDASPENSSWFLGSVSNGLAWTPDGGSVIFGDRAGLIAQRGDPCVHTRHR